MTKIEFNQTVLSVIPEDDRIRWEAPGRPELEAMLNANKDYTFRPGHDHGYPEEDAVQAFMKTHGASAKIIEAIGNPGPYDPESVS